MTALAQYPSHMDRSAMATEQPKRLAIELPAHERGRSDYDIQLHDRITARLARNAYRSTSESTAAEKREADLKARANLEAQAGLKAAEREVRDGITESKALAAGRGETVAEDTGGVQRILDRDPLLSLVRAGKITLDQMEAGQFLRQAYELRGDDAGSVEYDGMPGAAHDHERFVANRFTRAKATMVIGQVSTAVLCGHFRTAKGYMREAKAFAQLRVQGIQPHIALTTLRAVCGEGKTLSSQGKGRTLDRNAKALAIALDVVAEVVEAR